MDAREARITDVRTLWREDVMMAWAATANHAEADKPQKLMEFMAAIEMAHDLRWKRDPKGGEGAVAWFKELFKGGIL